MKSEDNNFWKEAFLFWLLLAMTGIATWIYSLFLTP